MDPSRSGEDRDPPIFSEQDYLDICRPLSGGTSLPEERVPVQVCEELKNEEAACTRTSQDCWSIRLMDSAQGSNSRTASLCISTSALLSGCLTGQEVLPDSGLLWARVLLLDVARLEETELIFRVAVPWLQTVIFHRSKLSSTGQELMDTLLRNRGHSDASGKYLLKLCDTEEYLRSDEMLGICERIQVYQKFDLDVPVRMVLRSTAKPRLTPDEEDARQMFDFSQVLASDCAFSTMRTCLQEKLNGYCKEVEKLVVGLRGISGVVASVRGICDQLCGITSVDLEEAVGHLKRTASVMMKESGEARGSFLRDERNCDAAVHKVHQSLLNLLHVFFTNFDLDFRGPKTQEMFPETSDSQLNSHMLQLTLTSLYRLPPGWLNSFDHLSVICSLLYGSGSVSEPVQSQNISLSLQVHSRIHCSRLLVFPVLVRELPHESVLTFQLLGLKPNKSSELLCWAALPLFNKKTLTSGSVLLSMTSQPMPSRCPPSPAMNDGLRQPTGVILQVDFPVGVQWQYERVLPSPGTSHESACEELHQRIRVVSQKHCLPLMSDNEKAFLWSKRWVCSRRNSSLHLVLGSAPQWKPQNLPEIYSMLETWGSLSFEEALFLLSDDFPDQHVRSVAVQCFQKMNDSELQEFLPQLVQALKMEWEIEGPLLMFLLSRAVRCVRVAQQLYWLLVDALEDEIYRSWMKKALSALKHCCGRAFRRELEQQSRLMLLLSQVADKVRNADKAKRKDVFSDESLKIASFFADGSFSRLPLDPGVVVKGVNIEGFKLFNSNAAPVEISFVTSDPLGQNYSVLCKTGDDLRQDMLVLQMVRLVERMWREDGLDMRMVLYRCISTGKNQGLVELVTDSVTLAKIQQEWGLSGVLREDTLEKWFHMRNKSAEEYEKAVINFLHSCAGWCVVTFVLGICDRHNDNIMIKHSGHMFHIDFGKIMGNAQMFANIKRDRSPFIYTSEMQRFITGGGTKPQRFHRFVELCCEAYNSLRRRTPLILGFLQLMLGAGMPELKDIQDLQYVHNNLRPHDSELEATSYFTKKIKESLESLPVKINFLIHNMVQFPLLRRSEETADQNPSNTNIQDAVIQGYSMSGKDVKYEVKVTMNDGHFIGQKSFAEFEMIHKLLQKHFIESTLPKFPGWFTASLTASKKMRLLNRYLKELFEGPCKGNEYVCALFTDGPTVSVASENETLLRPQIQLYLSYKNYNLCVMVKHLKNIRLSNGSCPDAYVVTRLRPDPQDKTKRKTKVVRNNEHPTFNELIEYRNVLSLHGRVLEVTVKSKKMFVAATNVVLGERVLDEEKWFPLGCSPV